MGFRPTPGFMVNGRARLRQASALTTLLFLLAACGGSAELGDAPVPSAEAIPTLTDTANANAATMAVNGSVPTPANQSPGESTEQRGEAKEGGKANPALVLRPPEAEPQHAIPLPHPYIVKASRKLQCVPYARKRTGIAIRGDAWTWWKSARGRYQRSKVPAVGAVLVLKRRGHSRGHLAVVTQVVNDREIIVDHANWLNHGRIHRNIPVRDVSSGNDWSAVRLWHVPTQHLGVATYRAYGFVYPAEPSSLTSELPSSQPATQPDRG